MKNNNISPGGKFIFIISYIFCFIIEYFCGTLKSEDILFLIFINLIGAIIITYILVIIYSIVQRLNNNK